VITFYSKISTHKSNRKGPRKIIMKRKIIPYGSISIDSARQYPSFQVFDQSNTAFQQYISFIEQYGGGNVYPCAMPLPQGTKSKTGQSRAVIIQTITNPVRVEDDHCNGLRGEYWTDEYRPIARMNQGDQVLMKVVGEGAGEIYYWTQKRDGLNFVNVKVADDFHSFLDLLYEDRKLGSTNPWNSMKSYDAPPAVDFIYR